MKVIRQLSTLFIVVLALQTATGQMFPYRTFTVKDGLSSSIVFGMVQDTGQFLWFATDNGISRFDGRSFRNFTTKDNLSHNSVTSLFAADDGALYASTYGKGINVFRDKAFSQLNLGTGAPSFLNEFVVRNDTLFSFLGNTFYIFPPSPKNDTATQPIAITGERAYLSIFLSRKNEILVSSTEGLYCIQNGRLVEFELQAALNEPVHVVTDDQAGNLWFATKNRIFRSDKEGLTEVIKPELTGRQRIKRIMAGSDNRLWFSVLNSGLFFYEDGRIRQVGGRFGFDETEINFVHEDHEKNIWVGTYGKGIFCFNNLFISNYTTDDGLSNNFITDIITDKTGKVLIGTFLGLNIMEGEKTIRAEKIHPVFGNYIWELSEGPEDATFVVAGDNRFVEQEYDGTRLLAIPPTSVGMTGQNGYIRGSWYNYLMVYTSDHKEDSVILLGEMTEKGHEYNRINAILFREPDDIWAGTSKGLWRVKDGIAYGFHNDPVLSTSIWDMQSDAQGNLWIAASGGIAVEEAGKFVHHTETDGYDLTSSSSIAFDDKGRTWVGSPGGLLLLDEGNARLLDRHSGLISSEVTSLHFRKESRQLFVGTVQGLSVIDLEGFDRFEYPVPRLFFLINGFPVGSSPEKLKIPYKESSLRVRFSPLYLRNPEAVTFRYKLLEKQNNWEETKSTTLDFAWLGVGNHTLLISAKGENNIWSDPVTMEFYIVPPFWKTTLFLVLSFIVLVLLIILIAWMRFRAIKRRIDERMVINAKISELKHQAFSAAMNPHFIFNALNSIQHFINASDPFSANEYLAKFSRLIRMNLEEARKGEIRISQEIKRITAYLELEQLRFGNDLQYKITVGNGIDAGKTLIPNMIIQPYVENAIWHGIQPQKKGNVDISFEKDSKANIVIRITDDGIGIEKGRTIKKSNHVSMGMKIIADRLEMLKKEPSDKEFITVTDLNKHGKSGTEVKITLPPYSYSIMGQ